MSQLIAAISTPPGPGGVGILRLSGPGAIGAASQAFRPRGKVPLAQAPDRQLLYGAVLDRDGRTIDTGLAFVSRAPHSYTGEETAELQCHGSPMVLSLALEALYAAGARPARPGEFTQRAFLNGKLDLTQAEAVIDLIDAESPSAARQAAGQLTGALSRRIEGIYSALTDTMAHFCAVLDYPDEDLDPFQTEALGRDLQAQASALQALATHLPGTTRDTIEVKVELAGRPFRLVDTAGLRDSDDPIEQLGVDRSRQAMAQADLLLMVCDGTQPLDPQDQALLDQALAQADTILAVNKGDLPGYRLPAPEAGKTGHTLTVVELSAKTGLGLAALEQAMGRLADHLLPQVQEEAAGQLLTNGRQTDAVRRALEAVERAQAALGELTGKTLREDITQRIFDRFCVGK